MASHEPEVNLPDELVAGVFATHLTAWHTPYELVLDLAAQEEPGEYTSPVRVVSRLRLPIVLGLEALDTLRGEMGEYERVYGEIRRPRPRGETGR